MDNNTWNMPKINDIMKQQGIIQKDLADKIGTSVQLMSYYFTSKPTLHKAKRLASALSNGEQIDWRELII